VAYGSRTDTAVKISSPSNSGLPTFGIKFKSQVNINGVVLIPIYYKDQDDWENYQNNVAIYGKTVAGAQQLLGVLGNYYKKKYGEILCSIQANEIIVVQQNSKFNLIFSGFGVLSDCDCSKSQFDPSLFTITPTTLLVSITSLTV
jgi:hypothetical protein